MGLLEEVAAQGSATELVAHRPWRLPTGPWVMAQSWAGLLFAHWRVEHDLLRPLVPEPLELEQFDGSAWVGLTPFLLTGLRLRGLPPLPGLSRFHELNCRTYVGRGGRPGIWFFSLDASSRLFVESAKLTYRLPYHHARIEANGRFRAQRVGAPGVRFASQAEPAGDELEPAPGTLEHFLTERYCLYADGGRARAEIHHRPWRLRPAQATVEVEGLAPVPLAGEPVCHLAARQDVVVWPLERVP